MNFVHPWMFVASAAIGLPLLIHWLTRPRPVRLPLSTIRFVREAIQQRRARHRVRDWIILLLRGLAVALLVAAFARPWWGKRPLVPTDTSAGAVRVVLLDQSLGMDEVSHGASAFDRARATAAKYLSYNPGARANLILAAAKPHAVADRLTSNFGALRDELSTAKPLAQRLDSTAAINLAARLLATGSANQRRELIIISNFQRTNWANADFSPLPKETQIQLESVAPAQTPANVAILKVAARNRAEQGREVRIEVEVGNYSSQARKVKVELIAQTLTSRLSGQCPAGVKTTLTTTITPSEAGWQSGQARLLNVEDALASDNVRPFVLEVHPNPTYALITRQSPTPQASSSHFLERGLAPFRPTDSAASHLERVKRIAPDALDRDSLAGTDLIVLDHPGKLSSGQMAMLAGLLRRGRAVLYVASEPVDATNLKLLAQAAGTEMKMPVEFAPPSSSSVRKDLFLADMKRNSPPFRAFGESLSAAVAPLRFTAGLNSHPAAGGLAEEILAEYDNHSACLIATPCGAGTLAVLNADLNHSNLVASSVFVPLLEELVERLMGHKQTESAATCGEAVAAYLPPESGTAAGLKIVAPGGVSDSAGSVSDDGGFVLWRWNAAGAPGVYAIRRDSATVYALAAAPPASASDLTPIDPQTLASRLAGERSIAVQSAIEGTEQHDDLWSMLLIVCATCLLLELISLKAFST